MVNAMSLTLIRKWQMSNMYELFSYTTICPYVKVSISISYQHTHTHTHTHKQHTHTHTHTHTHGRVLHGWCDKPH